MFDQVALAEPFCMLHLLETAAQCGDALSMLKGIP
jgi:hypothetical protein